jgi:hypothetical protein
MDLYPIYRKAVRKFGSNIYLYLPYSSAQEYDLSLVVCFDSLALPMPIDLFRYRINCMQKSAILLL